MNNIAILSSRKADSAISLYNFFREGNRITVDCVISDTQDNNLGEVLSTGNIPLFTFTEETWKNSPETILELLRSRNISIMLVDELSSEIPDSFRTAYPRTIITLRRNPDSVCALRLTPEGEEVIITDTPDNAETLAARAVVKSVQSPIVSRQPAIPVPPTDDMPSPEQEWAEKLNINYNTAGNHCPPPVPTPPTAPEPINNFAGAMHPKAPEARPPMPDSYLLWSILSLIFCCFIPSIVAIIYSAKVSSRYYAGDYKGSERASRNAQIWIIVSIVFGIVSSTLYFPLMMLGN